MASGLLPSVAGVGAALLAVVVPAAARRSQVPWCAWAPALAGLIVTLLLILGG